MNQPLSVMSFAGSAGCKLGIGAVATGTAPTDAYYSRVCVE